jgi:HK97 family phage prohead protease
MITKQFSTQVKTLSGNAHEFTISTGDLDRHKDRVDQAGINLSSYRKNPVVLWSHSYSSLPIGKCTSIGLGVGGNLKAVVEYAPSDINPMGQQVRKLVEKGFISATSIGFVPLDETYNDAGGKDYHKIDLLEFSLVSVPANSGALVSRSALAERAKSASQRSLPKTFEIDAYDILMAIDKELARRDELTRAKRSGELVFRLLA